MKKLCFCLLVFFELTISSVMAEQPVVDNLDHVTITKARLLDKIKGGWAGQAIGCTYGGPTEFKYCGTMIQDYIPIHWSAGQMKWYYENEPGLYDDVYMDLTFVDVFDRLGLDAPVDSFAIAFANAGYSLWHANQAARYNILNGIMPPESGNWKNNPHADDIDYQIEADYSGLMSPGMPNTASGISDKIGHIMCYGNGWYGGVFVGAMYSLAFLSDNMEYIVTEALKTIPQKSLFYLCISDVIKWHKQYPEDWKRTWFECQKKYSEDYNCPEGIFLPFDIDATINSAYIVIGLLYGGGDFSRTLEIATRCGQDSDCNPASAGGIIGTMLGYNRIPPYWMNNLKEVEDLNFAYTSISLNKAYQMSFKQALQEINLNGGKINKDNVIIKKQTPIAVRFEKSFDGIYPVDMVTYGQGGEGLDVDKMGKISFNGTGITICGRVDSANKKYVALLDVYVDGQMSEEVKLPASFHARRQELFTKYNLLKDKHVVSFKWVNPISDGTKILCNKAIFYSDSIFPIYKKK